MCCWRVSFDCGIWLCHWLCRLVAAFCCGMYHLAVACVVWLCHLVCVVWHVSFSCVVWLCHWLWWCSAVSLAVAFGCGILLWHVSFGCGIWHLEMAFGSEMVFGVCHLAESFSCVIGCGNIWLCHWLCHLVVAFYCGMYHFAVCCVIGHLAVVFGIWK